MEKPLNIQVAEKIFGWCLCAYNEKLDIWIGIPPGETQMVTVPNLYRAVRDLEKLKVFILIRLPSGMYRLSASGNAVNGNSECECFYKLALLLYASS